jgi:Domain of unknown function (DUF4082)
MLGNSISSNFTLFNSVSKVFKISTLSATLLFSNLLAQTNQSDPFLTLFSDSDVSVAQESQDSAPVNLGVKFKPLSSGYIVGIRFYTFPNNKGPFLVNLWDSEGIKIAEGFGNQNINTPGWITVYFPEEVEVSQNEIYTASYFSNTGNYSFSLNFFQQPFIAANAALEAPESSIVGGNGVYNYNTPTLPTLTYLDSNYWVEPIFSNQDIASALWAPVTVPSVPFASDPNPVELGVRFSSAVDGYITGVTFYKDAQNTGPHTGNLWSNNGELLATGTFATNNSSGWQTLKFNNPVKIQKDVSYVASYFTQNGYAFDFGGLETNNLINWPLTALAGANNGLFTYGTTSSFPTSTYFSSQYWVSPIFSLSPQGTPISSATYSIFTNYNGVELPTSSDKQSVELGVKFAVAEAGKVSAIRFYKGTENVGPFVGNLWSNEAVLLGTTGVASSTIGEGWVELSFATPIDVAANTTYVASYFTESGSYAFTSNFFKVGIGYESSPLVRALDDIEANGNGVFNYGPVSSFPSSSWSGSNYWVDVVFTPNS